MENEKRGRGRPRPDFTQLRDEQVFQILHHNGPTGRLEIAQRLQVNLNIIYLSLHRLRNAGRVEKVRRGKYHLWAVAASN